MKKPPKPVCKALLVCRQLAEDPLSHEQFLLGLIRWITAPNYPAQLPLAIFSRWTCGHGDYKVEVQLQTTDGEVVWRDGPEEPWKMADPLRMFDLSLRVAVRFPSPGSFDIVILANGDEVDRHPFQALTPGQAPSGH
jgi:hypothetical protein